ncbi:DUF1214 domain-containing protein [Ciceribacter sp. L1K23]|uniref:DUF1214 domain-containing protein n=1 Tax=Ciceribacter sp. L1K23 TaxID=2820276 RepID=UPI001B8122BA|nr:DUF1214 domain-containing protein [Ciceribacter sp. L1K23]
MFRVPLLVALALAIAFGGGIGVTLSALNASAGMGAVRVGVWSAFPEAQLASADPYAKSHRARAGRLLYGSAEGLTFTARTDDSGQRLTGTCSYRIRGASPPARLWTLYAADAGGLPLQTPAGLPGAINSLTVLRDGDGLFDITISPTAQPMNWIALADTGGFQLVMTLFDTPASGNSGLIGFEMPSVAAIGCGDE